MFPQTLEGFLQSHRRQYKTVSMSWVSYIIYLQWPLKSKWLKTFSDFTFCVGSAFSSGGCPGTHGLSISKLGHSAPLLKHLGYLQFYYIYLLELVKSTRSIEYVLQVQIEHQSTKKHFWLKSLSSLHGLHHWQVKMNKDFQIICHHLRCFGVTGGSMLWNICSSWDLRFFF